MTAKNRQKLRKSCIDLLENTAGDLIPELEKNQNLIHVKQSAFEWYSEKTEELFQVQVVVTRSQESFLEFMQIEKMSEYSTE